MRSDRNAALERRAMVHAALSEPSRLAVVDALSVGDASPSELQGLLGMPSNLLAHHLKVLEQAEIVARSRSQGDGRRTYLRLVAGSLADLLPTGALPTGVAPPARVVFVCTHNSARSQLAVALWRERSQVPATSAGTHPAAAVDPGALATARRHGLELRGARPRAMADVAGDGDVVITVCDRAHEELGGAALVHWSVPDPVRVGTDDAFDRAFEELTHRVGNLAARVHVPQPDQ
ncbi:arsenate reductase/protein-tyrosine-phosphatase family protein [Pengzhenrongella sicca]|uniref:Helix-turn-helix domain-containing protein n=1 Tax=Pengzhenrongella sicca TaxID=2819238 RepID=A0A8A4ZAV4_9MICO|nr:helix-turn-helix domain-containing protein [Pengzhenrongella sicca]QTE28149.1 helix-turn-helix domain-containing protein [Pengzhenrongella sicca]